ncbi:MAG: hypothetical protein EXQ96_02005 [Alphaproteobacteria bacterium]|nr:hypothetical protein [Alphaproteobacteria bacterium]
MPGPLAGQTIGVIGLGLMGKPMARNLAKAGATVVIHNRSRGLVVELAAEGLVPADGDGGLDHSALHRLCDRD